MENASKALIIAGAILLSILIIAIGMFIYTSSQSTINDSLTQMNTQEIEAFNSQFTVYGGAQTGAKLKSMCGTLIANANTYASEPAKLPGLYCSKIDTSGANKNANRLTDSDADNQEALQNYINDVAYVRNKLENKHTYYVDFDYSTKGVLVGITIYYTKQ